MQISLAEDIIFFLYASTTSLHYNYSDSCYTVPTSKEVEVIFPNGKKTKAATGAKLKDVASKAGYKPNYGCEVLWIHIHFCGPISLDFIAIY